MLFRFFENLVSPFPSHPATQPPAKLSAFIWHYARDFRWLLLGIFFTSMANGVVEVLVFDLVGSAIDWMTEAESPDEFWASYGGRLIMLCLFIAILWPLLAFIDDLLMLQGAQANFPMAIRWRGHRYLLRQSTSFFATDFAGRISTKLMQSALGVRDIVVKSVGLFSYIGTYILAALFLFAANDWRLSIPALIWLILYVAVMFVFLPRLRIWSERSSDARSILTGRIVDAYTNIQTVKLFAGSDAEEDYARDGMQKMLDVFHPQFRLVTVMSTAMHVINALFVSSTIALGAWLWSTGQVSVGSVAFAGALVMRIQGLSHYFLWELAGLFENIGSAADGMGTLAKPRSVEDKPDAKPLAVRHGQISYDDVSFHYGQERSVVSNLSLDIAPGEKVGLVGRSGAGKSTLMNLLLRLYDVEGGKISIDDQNIADAAQESVRQHIAVVTQDTSLLHRSIRENIAYSRPNATEAEIIAAAKRASAWEFIETLEDHQGRRGLDAQVGERGVKLSGGQRQRIAIARVILKDAPILVLDEATSALDSDVEAAIQGQLNDLMEGKTVVAIAHRLSTIAAMDRLVVMADGEIAEQGTHDELIAAGGLYARLWARQSGGFLAKAEDQ